ncbi:hypothetical protein KQH27_01080 [bacterium]|nr:hypothetical protein [bacterium]
MPSQEFGVQVGNARFKFAELVSTANGVYWIFPIPEMQMHLSFHYPNEHYDTFGAFLRVPGLDLNYKLELDEDILTVNNLLKYVESFGTIIGNGYLRELDDSEVMVLPSEMINGFSREGRKNYFDLSAFLSTDWRITEADRLPDLVSRSKPTVVGVSLSRKNTAIMYDREFGSYQLSLDELTQAFHLDLLGESFSRSLSDALEEIETRRPDVLEKATPNELIEEIKSTYLQAGAIKRD